MSGQPHDHGHEHHGHAHGHDHAHAHDHDGHEHDHGRGHDHHGHSHGPGGHHHHAPASYGLAFAVGIGLNTAYVAAEATYGVLSNSLALIADAGHNLGDVLGLVLAWVAVRLSKRAPSARFTYGLRGSSILAALANAVLLLVVTGGIAWEAVQRLFHPQPTAGVTIMVVSAIGVVINGASALMFMSGSKGDLNIRGAFLHLAADALVSLGVVVTGGVILLSGWMWLDPAISLVISLVIVWGTWSLLRESLNLALHGVPAGIDEQAVQAFLASAPGVTEVHDLHIWGMSTTETALTAHLVRPEGPADDELLHRLCDTLQSRFHIGHATLQFETGDHPCSLAAHTA
jgi:cobalt-zinc-cadmium efflux system protein